MVKGSSYQSPQEFGSPGASVDPNEGGIEQSETAASGDSGTIDPATIAGPGNAQIGETIQSGVKKRGRPKGWKPATAKAATSTPLDVNGLNKLIYSVHDILATATKIPEIKLDEDESLKLSQSTVDLAKHYNIAVSEKTMAWSNFIATIGAVYGTRLAAVINEKRKATTRVGQAASTIAGVAQRMSSQANGINTPNAGSMPPANPYKAATDSIRPNVHGNA